LEFQSLELDEREAEVVGAPLSASSDAVRDASLPDFVPARMGKPDVFTCPHNALRMSCVARSATSAPCAG
jgi:hypothetical protein